MRRQRLLDGKPGQLVSKRDAVRLRLEHAGGQAFLEVVACVAGESLEQPQLGLLRHDRHRFEH